MMAALKNHLVFLPFCAGATYTGTKGGSQNQSSLFNSLLASCATDSGTVFPWEMCSHYIYLFGIFNSQATNNVTMDRAHLSIY